MERSQHVRRLGQAVLAGAWFVALIGQLALDLAVDWTFDSALATFWVVVLGASTCAGLALVVTIRGYRTHVAETALLGSFLVGASVLPLAHGLLLPGVIFGPNPAAETTMLFAVPVSALALLPLLAPRSRVAAALPATWRLFVPAHVVLVVILATASILWRDAVPAAPGGGWVAGLVVLSALVICRVVSLRHLRLAVVAARFAPLSVAVGFAMIGSAPLVGHTPRCRQARHPRCDLEQAREAHRPRVRDRQGAHAHRS